MAFLVWVESSDYSSQIESRGRVLHTLIGRYAIQSKVKMKSLYIIGNGFDLYHGFKTKYSDFAKYLQVHNLEVLDLINKYYYQEVGVSLWSDFETSLANLDKEYLLDDLKDYLPVMSSDDFRDRDWYSYSSEIRRKVGMLTHELCEEFRRFILLATSINQGGRKFDLSLQSAALYFSFNYSDTLEKHYSIPHSHITYIHGQASNASDKLILGHGIDPETFATTSELPPENPSEVDLERWYEYMSDNYDYAYDQGVKEVYDYFTTSFKNSAQNIKKHSDFFSSLSRIENVYVLGHSLSQVDLPYFQEIYANVPDNCKWYVSFRGEAELHEKREAITCLGVARGLINMIDISDV
ncbi:bacteriophage abortive infection AbiH family protein [Vibrio vulnificus]